MGYYSVASRDYATAIGTYATASGFASKAIGFYVTAPSRSEVVVGQCNKEYTPLSATDWYNADRLFVIGNGSSPSDRSNALTVLKSGRIGIGTEDPQAILEVVGNVIFRSGTIYGTGPGGVTSNTVYGWGAFQSNNTGSGNTAIGAGALSGNVGLSGNTAVGRDAMRNANNDSSIGNSNNTAVGAFSLHGSSNRANNTGTENSSLGTYSLWSCTSGGYNTAVGSAAGKFITTGNYNTVMGRNSGINLNTGSNNVLIGYNAGNSVTSGSNNIAIGISAAVPSGTANNQVRIGNTSITYAGIQVAWTVTSDLKWKEGIRDIDYGLSFITRLRPVDYLRKHNLSGKREAGFIAQDVEKIISELEIEDAGLLSRDSEGSLELRYNDFIPILTKAIQEQQQIIDNQNLKIESQQAEFDRLKAEVEALKSMIMNSAR
jgi:hypothetical protein